MDADKEDKEEAEQDNLDPEDGSSAKTYNRESGWEWYKNCISVYLADMSPQLKIITGIAIEFIDWIISLYK